MDYEKAYNEALERAKNYHDNNFSFGTTQLTEAIFPELKESEDERIRKEMIEYFHGCIQRNKKTGFRVEQIKGWIDYLEKQREQKQKQSEDEKEYARTLESLISDFLRGKDEIDREYYQKIYDWLDNRHIEQKPAKKDEIGYDLGRKKGMDAGIEYVLNHLELYGLCKPAEWSEEDEHLIDEAAEMLRRYAECVQGGNSKIYVGCLADKIESLRPHPHWKPREEQMWALDVALENFYHQNDRAALESLRTDLQKLL